MNRTTTTAAALALLVLLLVAACVGAPVSAETQAPGTFLRLTEAAAKARLERSRHKTDFLPLSMTFATQIQQTLCSAATAVTVLNALPLTRPVDRTYKPYPYFTQTNYFNDGVAAIRSYNRTLSDGMTLQMAARAMRVHGAKTEPHHAAETTLAEFRRLASENLARDGDFVIVNYQRKFIGQPKGAHFSPLGAYDAATDTFLIMDVARYKYPPVWVRAEDLFNAMNTKDSETPRSRGFILVSAP